APFFNEFSLTVPMKSSELIKLATQNGIHIGVNITARHSEIKDEMILMSFSDIHTEDDLAALEKFMDKNFKKTKAGEIAPEIPVSELRKDAPQIPQIPVKEIISYYETLGKQNLSPDDGIYPLGSCTMKYNPY